MPEHRLRSTLVVTGVVALGAACWAGWYHSATALAGVCPPGRDAVHVPSGEVDPEQASVCTG